MDKLETDSHDAIAYCPACESQITLGDDECPSCGQPLCPECGDAVAKDATACPSCGSELEWFCSVCGAGLHPSDAWCQSCGTEFHPIVGSGQRSGSSPPPPVPPSQFADDEDWEEREVRQSLELHLAAGERLLAYTKGTIYALTASYYYLGLTADRLILLPLKRDAPTGQVLSIWRESVRSLTLRGTLWGTLRIKLPEDTLDVHLRQRRWRKLAEGAVDIAGRLPLPTEVDVKATSDRFLQEARDLHHLGALSSARSKLQSATAHDETISTDPLFTTLEQQVAETKYALRVGAGILFVSIGVALLMGAISTLVLGGDVSEICSPPVGIVIDLVIAASLWEGNTKWRSWAVIRAVLGLVVYGLLALSESDYLLFLAQAGLSGALIIVFTGRSSRRRTWAAVGTYAVGLVALGVLMLQTATLSSAALHNERGVELADQGNLDEAALEFQEAIRLQPDSAMAHSNLGWVYHRQGELDAALESYQKAIELDPSLADALAGLGWVLLDRDDLDKAVGAFEKAIKIDPNSVDAYLGLGWALYLQDRRAEAVEAFQQVTRLDPSSVDAYSGLGWSYYHLGKLDKAIEAFQVAIDLSPDWANAHDGLGWAYLVQGKLDKAEQAFQEALRLDPDFADARDGLETVEEYQETLP